MTLRSIAFALLLTTGTHVCAAAAPTDARIAAASQAFAERRYAAAYGRFAALADTGHAPSAHVALVMFEHGGALFGNAWYASPDQQRRWNALVLNDARRRAMMDAVRSSE